MSSSSPEIFGHFFGHFFWTNFLSGENGLKIEGKHSRVEVGINFKVDQNVSKIRAKEREREKRKEKECVARAAPSR